MNKALLSKMQTNKIIIHNAVIYKILKTEKKKNYVRLMILSRVWVTIKGFGLENGFIDHCNTRLVTTINYNSIADIRTLQISTAHAKSPQSAMSSPVVSW
jgi:hypothetical protein